MRFNYDGVIGEITNLPGCDQIAVSHNVWLRPELRAAGRGKIAHARRLEEMQFLGYDYTLCTVDMKNEAQRHILETNGWKKFDEFKSGKTGNTVGIFGRKL